MKTDQVKVRNGNKNDIPQVFNLIKELAIYEKAEHEVENTIEQLIEDGFSENPLFGLLVAEKESKVVGISLYYFRYSTWKGKRLYLEDIVVSESVRGEGIGSQLFEATMRKSITLNCNGMSWAVLDWNEPAIKFYKKYNAVFDKEWMQTALSKDQIQFFFNKKN